jgi:hypothetical protein
MEYKEDIYKLYLNYMKSIEARKEYGDKYGDTEELIKMYEKKLEDLIKPKKILSLEREKYE